MISQEVQNNNVSHKVDTDKLSLLLKNVNRPGRYIGSEYGAAKKDFEKASVKVALAFPDLYEIGISNLGLKIIYNIINSKESFLADRVYAPDKDFKDILSQNNFDLYAVETFVPLKMFDVLAFSLQYELNYTTMIGMLDSAGIPIFAKDRNNTDTLVIAGGPSCYNPEPIADFVDAVLPGDGENVIIKFLDVYHTFKKEHPDNDYLRIDLLKALSKIDGVYVPSLYSYSDINKKHVPLFESLPSVINKSHAQMKAEDHPVISPLPYIESVHDRSVVEIRRGCARMCRFCQSCFVHLPVREREPDEVKDLCRKTLKASGYDEFSLLSFSSSDYKGLESLAIELNNEFAAHQISISLPSQRADAFNLDLAKQIQAVRKSTLTFAPEAGSERLRCVINKNLTEEQIIDAALSAFNAGWFKIKLYFIIGLPTETYEDLDSIIDLIAKIRRESNAIRITKKGMRPLDITCTISNFVPKPFTPFQWFGMIPLEEMYNRKRYLIEKARGIKGVKLNFHDVFSSKLECLFGKGTRDLSNIIINAYNNGAYLDSWTDYFSKNIWEKTAEESKVDIEYLTTREYDCNEALPWEIINVGVDKQWLIKERALAIEAKNSVPCEDHCINCGVCVNLGVSPKYESRKKEVTQNSEIPVKESYDNKYRYRLKLTKTGNLRYISHLDWFRVIYRAAKRAKLPVVFSQGFNPSPKISIGVPLGLFLESNTELMDVELTKNLDEKAIMSILNDQLPRGCEVLDVTKIDLKADSIAKALMWSEYEAVEENSKISNYNFDELEEKIASIMSNESVIITKKTKRNTREVNIKPAIHSVIVEKDKPEKLKFVVSNSSDMTVKPDEFLNLFSNGKDWKVRRIKLMDINFQSL